MTNSGSDKRNSQRSWDGPRFDAPATFRILARGRLDPSWAERLGGMSVRALRSEDGVHLTELEGRLADQAALSGVLDTIYNLRLTLLTVECLDTREKEKE